MRIMCREKTTNYLYKKEGDEMKLSDVKKPDIIYHVKVDAHSSIGRYGQLIEKENGYSNIFFTHKKAYEEGFSHLKNSVRRLYEASRYCKGYEDDLTIEDFIGDGQISYSFTIMEIDLEAAKTYKWYDGNPSLGDCLANRPPFLEYTYNLGGDLIDCNYTYCDNTDWEAYGTTNMVSYIKYRPGDEKPDAGTKFKSGDLVRLVRPYFFGIYQSVFDTDQVFVVLAGARRDKSGALKENTYVIETVLNDGTYVWDLDFGYPFQGIHECELTAYGGELSKNDPLCFLQKVARGEFGKEATYDIINKLESGEISFRNAVSWRAIPELKAAIGPEEEAKK